MCVAIEVVVVLPCVPEIARHRAGELAANGRDMTALGLTGPAVGKMLRRLLSEVMSGKLENDRETLLRRAQQLTDKKRLDSYGIQSFIAKMSHRVRGSQAANQMKSVFGGVYAAKTLCA